MSKKKREKRGFTIHGREFWYTKNQLSKELGVPTSHLKDVWRSGKKKKR